MIFSKFIVVLTALLLLPPALSAQTLAIRGATLYPISSELIRDGVLIVENGRITALGPASQTAVPDGAEIIDAGGMVLMPGLVDTHSHLGVRGDHGESSSAVTPGLRILDSLWSADPRIRVARSAGITTANIMPGSGNVIGGQTVYVKLAGDTVEQMLVPGSVGGLKMANGENPRARSGEIRPPATRMGVAAMARQQFYDAMAYREKQQRAEQGPDAEPPPRDLGMEALLEVLDGKRVVHHHTHRGDDIMTVLRLQDEFGFRLVLQHAVEAYKVADQLARLDNVQVSYLTLDSPGGKHEAFDVRLGGAAILEQAGLEIALHSDDWVVDSRFLRRSAALAVRGGMTRDAALRALTINGARMLDLDDRIGSLEVGKDADLVLLSGDPFSVYTHVQKTWIDGELVFDRDDPLDRLYATGGHRVADRYPAAEEAGQ